MFLSYLQDGIGKGKLMISDPMTYQMEFDIQMLISRASGSKL